jgi:DNA-binding FadR family transcriptional regulator
MARAKARPVRTVRAEGRLLRIHGSIARDLGLAIVSGELEPGDLLDGEIESSSELRVSRTAYREAVRILAAKGLIESRPKIGTRISPREQWHLLDPDVLSWIFSGEPDVSIVRGIFELRAIVEPAATGLAAERRTRKHLEIMRRSLNEMAVQTLRTEAGRIADREFHAALLNASGNPFLISLTNGVTTAIDELTEFKQRDGPLARDPVPDHERVLDAVEAKNPIAAQAAMSELIRLAIKDTPINGVRAAKKRQRRAR